MQLQEDKEALNREQAKAKMQLKEEKNVVYRQIQLKNKIEVDPIPETPSLNSKTPNPNP